MHGIGFYELLIIAAILAAIAIPVTAGLLVITWFTIRTGAKPPPDDP